MKNKDFPEFNNSTIIRNNEVQKMVIVEKILGSIPNLKHDEQMHLFFYTSILIYAVENDVDMPEGLDFGTVTNFSNEELKEMLIDMRLKHKFDIDYSTLLTYIEMMNPKEKENTLALLKELMRELGE